MPKLLRVLRTCVLTAAVVALSNPLAHGADAPPAPPAAADSKPPIAPNGWKVETVLLAPKIESPSVVCALPDGRVLVAEDPLDNRGGKDPIDRILCLHPDGRLTVWADKLYPVFGLAYLDGKVYVHQYPILSVYDDADGKAANRKDLVSQTGKPTIGGLNDHIPSQIRFAMDGYFYMSIGDRGVWGAKSNVDGREAELAGGGVLRIRPDGTGMEVYATGTRNHLDVSMTSEDEKFTYDNTDDGHGWWTRFTHMVDGGYYGYPWDYKAPENKNDPASKKMAADRKVDQPFQPYTLWRMAEYGGGSPCGAVGYAEDALPPEYRDNLFHCEWGKGKVQRFVVKRTGGTFAVDRMEDFLTPGGDLRPLGIDVTADGLGFWVTDWGYGGWHQKKPEVGRLLKVTWTGKSHATPKPAWYVPAATGQKFEATTEQLIEGLKHPARSVRMVAQRRLAERGKDAVSSLSSLLADTKVPNHAKWHAIWALHQFDAGKAARGAIAARLTEAGADPSVVRQAVRQLGEAGAKGEVTTLLGGALSDDDASVRFHAATALGRAGDHLGAPFLTAMLDEKDLFTRYAMFTALNRIGRADPSAWQLILAGLEHGDEKIRANTTYALRNTYDPRLVSALAKLASDKDKPALARSAALLSAAELHRRPKPWGGQWWGTQPVGNPRPPMVVEWEGTTTVLSVIRDLAKDGNAEVRSAAIKAMTIAPDPSAVDLLVGLYGPNADPATRELILQALAPTKSPKAAALATAVLKDPNTPAALVPEAIAVVREAGGKEAAPVLVALVDSAEAADVLEPAIDALGSSKAKEAVPAIGRRLKSAEPRVWNASLNALQTINDKGAVDALLAGALTDKRPDVRKAAATALGTMKAKDAVPALVEAVEKKAIGGEAAQALTRIPDVRALDIYLGSLSDRNRGNARDARNAIEKIKADARPLIEQRLEAGTIKPEALAVLREIYGTFTPVAQWAVVGPFDATKPDPFDPATLTEGKGDVKTPEGGKLTWKKVKADNEGMVDLGKEVAGAGPVAAWLVAEVPSATEREAMIRLGSDDGHTVWLNGEKVADDRSNSGWKPDEQTVKVKLRGGKNLIVVRCANAGGGWQFSAAVGAERTGKLFEQQAAPLAGPQQPTRDAYAAFALTANGDPATGKVVFATNQAAACVKCHQAVQNEGGLIGPSLVGVGSKYDRAKLIESVVYPSKQIFDGFQQTIVRTKDDDVIAGVVKTETDQEVEIYDAAAQRIVVKKADIRSRKHSDLSAMPEGLEQAMTRQEFADLIAYLQSLKQP